MEGNPGFPMITNKNGCLIREIQLIVKGLMVDVLRVLQFHFPSQLTDVECDSSLGVHTQFIDKCMGYDTTQYSLSKIQISIFGKTETPTIVLKLMNLLKKVATDDNYKFEFRKWVKGLVYMHLQMLMNCINFLIIS